MTSLGDRGPRLSLYTSLLQAAVEDDPGESDMTLANGIATLLAKRAQVVAASRGSRPAPAPLRARATMNYDLALVRLCQRLGIEHRFFAGLSPDAARAGAEAALARRLPALSEDLVGWPGPEPEPPGAEPAEPGE